MLRALFASFVFSLSLLLSACGDDAGATAGAAAPPASTTASSNVVKGLIRNGVVSAWRWQEGQYVQVASTRTGASGDFTLDLSSAVPGDVLRLELGLSPDTSAANRTEMLCDVALCGSGVRGEWVPLASDLGLVSWASVGADGTLTLMPMTPVSTLLVGYAEDLGGGRLTAATLEVARLRVAALFGLTPEQLLTRPGNIANTLWVQSATAEAVRLSLISAAFAELANTRGTSIEQVIANFVERFNANDGHLLQDGETGSLGDLYRGISAILAAPGAPASPDVIAAWIAEAGAALQSGRLNSSACAPDCAPFDSNTFLNALGTETDSLGADLRRVMAEKRAATIEQLLTGELSRYGWLVSPDTAAVGKSALEIALYSMIGALGLPVSSSSDGLLVSQAGNVLSFSGSLNGLAVDLEVTVPQLLAMITAYTPGRQMDFTIGVKGTLQNDRQRASIDGSLLINAGATDFLPLKRGVEAYITALYSGNVDAATSAQAALFTAIAGIVRQGEATFTVDGSAALAQLELQGEALVETSRLAISGNAWMHLNMDGFEGTGIAANGKVEHGRLTLPNGDYFVVDPEAGHALTFALGRDGTAALNVAAHVLGHGAAVSGEGRVSALGPLLNNLRDQVATVLQSQVLDINALLAQLLADIGQLGLTVNGTAVIPDFGHTYTLALADGLLTISQPNSSATAVAVSLAGSRVLAQAGGLWWLAGLDLSTPGYPALTLADSTGGEWRWDFDFSGMLALAAAN